MNNPPPRFRVIVADPPWNHTNRMVRDTNDNELCKVPYATLTDDNLLNLPIESVADDTCLLALWTTSSHLQVALKCIESWGFTYKTTICWVKTQSDGKPCFGMGQYVRGSHELLLIATKGACRKALKSRSEKSAELSPRLLHSQKPELFQDKLERMFDGPYLEIFARRNRDNWVCIGNECPSTMGEDVRDSLTALSATLDT